MYTSVMNKKLIIGLSVIIGITFFVLAFEYLNVPAGSLPGYMPGFEAYSTRVHIKHGIASVLLGLATFAFTWFQTGKKSIELS